MMYHIYSDESRQSRERFMLFGGIIIEESDVPKFNATIAKFREEEGLNATIKWSKVSRAKLPQYKRFVDYFFALSNTNMIHFHSVIVDTNAVDHAKYNQGDGELGFHKFYYQLLLNCFGQTYAKNNKESKFKVFPDRRSSSYSLSELRKILNNGMAKSFQNYTEPFRAIEPRDEGDVELLQMTDVILGAIGYHKNGFHLLAGSSPPKIELAAYIAEKAGLSVLGHNTAYGRIRFKIWNLRLK